MKLCEDHPRYQAKRKPRLPCEECWRAWIRMEDARLAELVVKLVKENPMLCEQTIPGPHLEECVRKYGHDGECSSWSANYNK